MKRSILLIYKNLDPILKQEIVYIGTGVSIGWLVGKLVDKFDSKGLKKLLKREEDDIPKSRIRKLLAKLTGGEAMAITPNMARSPPNITRKAEFWLT